jgi:hypothetical protein
MEKEGFIYIWFDKKRKMYYIGCHWGTLNDGYICSSNRMRDAYRRRPNDFKRRILSKNIEKHNLLSEEHKWLSLISEEELGKKYYNLYTTNTSLKLAWAANKGRKQPEEEKAKRVKSNTGKKRTEETKQKIRESWSDERRNKASDLISGKNNYFYGKKLTGDKNGFYGKKHDPELKKKMNAKTSATMKGKPPNNAEWMRGTFWWNNGKINKRSKDCPGKDWTKGKVKG